VTDANRRAPDPDPDPDLDTDRDPDLDPDTAAEGLIGLRDAAEELDVHYMTAYRYVRTGRIAAEKQGGRWWIRKADRRTGLGRHANRDSP